MKRDPTITSRFMPRPTPVAAAVALALAAAGAHALPQGEQVAAGQVSVTRPAAGSMLVQQGSASAIVNWGSFSIDRGEAVRIRQPEASSVLLNRVVGNDASRIFGQLSANGRVFLVNPNGVLFGTGSSIDVGSLVASTLALGDADFLAGRLRFGGAVGAGAVGAGAVVNQGAITAAERGTVALLGGSVRNDGSIAARLGTVALAAGSRLTLDLAGDGLSSIAVTQGALDAQVANGGAIVADGGVVVLTARALNALAGDAVNHGGLVQARSLVERNGRIVLDGGGGTTLVSGTLDATGPAAGTTGGDIRVLGHHVGMAGAAIVDASGSAGGGTVNMGRRDQGSDPGSLDAVAAFFGKDATISADAIAQGNGGNVVLWGDEVLWAYGTISARGGAQGGHGGFIETSGNFLDTTGIRISAGARNGLPGQWLLDPYDVMISNARTASASPSPNFTATGQSPTGRPANVNANEISNALNAGTNVTVRTGMTGDSGQATGDMTINADIIKSAGPDAALTLHAHRNISVAPRVRIASTAGRLNVDFDSDSDGVGGGAIRLGTDSQIASNGGNVSFYGGNDPTAGRVVGINSQSGIEFQSGATIQTAGGNVILRGRGSGDAGIKLSGSTGKKTTIETSTGNVVLDGDTTEGLSGVGVRLTGSVIRSSTGDISLIGVGSGNGARLGDGVLFLSSSSINTSDGNIKIAGKGGAAGDGIRLDEDSSVTATGRGGVVLEGSGGAKGDGVRMPTGSSTSTSSGAITLRGQGGGTGEGFDGDGVNVAAVGATPSIQSSTGNIRLEGIGGGGVGVRLSARSGATAIRTSAGGSIDIRGIAQARGIAIGEGLNIITEGAPGTIAISGESAGSDFGVTLSKSASVGGNKTTGNVTLRALNAGGGDSLELNGMVQSSGSLNLRPGGVAASPTGSSALKEAFAEPIDIGGGNASFSISAKDQAALQDGFSGVVIGSTDHTGLISVNFPSDWKDNLTLQNAGTGSAGIAIAGAINNPGNLVTLSSGGSVTQTAPILAAGLLLHGSQPESNFQMTSATNTVGLFASRFEVPSVANPGSGNIDFVNSRAVTIGPLTGQGFDASANAPTTISAANSSSAGDFFVRTLAGDLTLGQNVVTLGSDITLVSGATFQNPGGHTLLPGGGGVWRVWADSWLGERRGGLTATTPRPNFYGCTFAPRVCAGGVTLPPDGNRFIYRQRPRLEMSADDKARLYGDANPPLTASLAGLVDANGDSVADAVGVVTLVTEAQATSPVGPYAIVASAPDSPIGYVLAFTPGTLGVDPAPLTIVADDKTRVYGSANPPLTRSVSGLVNGETEAVIAGGVATTVATVTTPVAVRPAITIGEASAANYAITRVDGAMTITPAPLTIVADDKTRLEGTRNPPLTATFAGLVAGDTPALAQQSGFALSTVANARSAGGTYAIVATAPALANYSVTAIPATLTVVRSGAFEMPTRVVSEATSDLYGRNQGVPALCTAGGSSPLDRAARGGDILSLEWSRVRHQPNLSQCIDLGQRNGCSDF